MLGGSRARKVTSPRRGFPTAQHPESGAPPKRHVRRREVIARLEQCALGEEAE